MIIKLIIRIQKCYRSVLNDDVGSAMSDSEIYTTWKARSKGGEENIVKHCIDYIFYSPFKGRDSSKNL